MYIVEDRKRLNTENKVVFFIGFVFHNYLLVNSLMHSVICLGGVRTRGFGGGGVIGRVVVLVVVMLI